MLEHAGGFEFKKSPSLELESRQRRLLLGVGVDVHRVVEHLDVRHTGGGGVVRERPGRLATLPSATRGRSHNPIKRIRTAPPTPPPAPSHFPHPLESGQGKEASSPSP